MSITTTAVTPAATAAGVPWTATFIDRVRSREMLQAIALFTSHWRGIAIDRPPAEINTPEFLDALARLLDRHKDHLAGVRTLLGYYHQSHAAKAIPLVDWTRIRLAEAVVAFHEHDLPRAIDGLTRAQRLADEAGDGELCVITRYYLARALYRTGDFDQALEVINQAETWAATTPPIANGLIKLVSAWLLFNTCMTDAEHALKAAKAALWGRDYLEDANIMFLEGRFARQEGAFGVAIERARGAIDLLDKHGASEHANAARGYVHMAYAQMLAAQAGNELADAEGRDALHTQILDTLSDAESICRRHGYPRVLDRVHYFRACWYLTIGNEAAAGVQAGKAYEVASSVHDFVVMAHARIIQCQCARNRHDPVAARRFAQEAHTIAEQTGNRRVKIRALIWKAFVASDPPAYNNLIGEQLMNEATRSLRDSDRDYLRWEFERLATQIDEGKRRVRNEELQLPATLDEALRLGGIEAILDDVTRKVFKAAVQRAGSTSRAAELLDTTTGRMRRYSDEHP